jgi:hypothetical protein
MKKDKTKNRQTRKNGKFERRSDQESKTRSKRRNDQERRMKNEERLMKKLGIRRLDATSSHLVKIGLADISSVTSSPWSGLIGFQ